MFPIIPSRVGGGSGGSNGSASRSPYRSENSVSSAWNTASSFNSKTILRAVTKETKFMRKLKSNEFFGGLSTIFIPKDTHSETIDSINGPLPVSDLKKIGICLSESGRLESKDHIPINLWITYLRFSNDVHSNNVMLELAPQQKLILRTTRNIDAGDEIQLWFSEDILAVMNIPFLTPANIRGKNSYTCHKCGKTYEYPNPLKIHLATNCNQEPHTSLWNRLQTLLITPSKNDLLPVTALYSSPSWPSTPHRISAFQPVWTSSKYSINPESLVNRAIVNMYSIPGNNETGSGTIAAAAHLETMVSNMGTSKQGHLCIYCGKLYSRKYGLKIHIRTHTGFKPLKCKYCFRPFGDPSNLNKHVRLHVQGNTVYKCDECDKILVRRRDLQRHIRTRHQNHSNDLPESGNILTGSSGNSSSSSSDEETVKNK